VIEKEHIKQALGSILRTGTPASTEKSDEIKNLPLLERSRGQSLLQIEEEAFRAQLQAHRGTRSQLAEKLGISERSLYRKLRAFGYR
jgi:DNA-binding NtrC family response regulator